MGLIKKPDLNKYSVIILFLFISGCTINHTKKLELNMSDFYSEARTNADDDFRILKTKEYIERFNRLEDSDITTDEYMNRKNLYINTLKQYQVIFETRKHTKSCNKYLKNYNREINNYSKNLKRYIEYSREAISFVNSLKDSSIVDPEYIEMKLELVKYYQAHEDLARLNTDYRTALNHFKNSASSQVSVTTKGAVQAAGFSAVLAKIGAFLGTIVAPGPGTLIGATIGGGIGGYYGMDDAVSDEEEKRRPYKLEMDRLENEATTVQQLKKEHLKKYRGFYNRILAKTENVIS